MLRCAVYLARRFVLRQNATVVGRFGAAFCFAGFVQFLLLNKNCTRAVDEFYLADKLSPPALVRDAFCLTAKCYAGRFISRGVLLCGREYGQL